MPTTYAIIAANLAAIVFNVLVTVGIHICMALRIHPPGELVFFSFLAAGNVSIYALVFLSVKKA